jgi:hypothetical protein
MVLAFCVLAGLFVLAIAMHVLTVYAMRSMVVEMTAELKEVVLEREQTLREQYTDSYDPLGDQDNEYIMTMQV